MKKRSILFLILATLTLNMHAQQSFQSRYVHLKNGQTDTIYASKCDSIVELSTIGFKVYYKNSEAKDYLYSQITAVDFFGEVVDADNNVNRNKYVYWTENNLVPNKYSNVSESWRLEYPHIELTANDQIVVKSTSDYGITLSLEWNYAKKANRWTCYQLHKGNLVQNLKRTDDFAEDTEIPSQYRSLLTDYSGSGFDRGHLCPSADRQCSSEQNRQTFFLSNMQPQYHAHNGGKWSSLEGYVRTMAEGYCDTLYVVKAATINDVTLNGSKQSGLLSEMCNGTLYVPAYFYMALLAYQKSTDTYQAIGIWTNHSNTANDIVIEYITIDELEKRTGIDFFCNLPDDIEEKVEATMTRSFWSPFK